MKNKILDKKTLLEKYQGHKNDTGSVSVQITLLTERINNLFDHLKDHKKDNDSRRGILILVGKRRKLLNYLYKIDTDLYQKLIVDLQLRK
jgi:small subunit ribosomal protein S15